MNSVRSVSLKGFICTVQGVIKRISVYVLATGFVLLVMGPVSARADLTQLEGLQWLVQVSGDSGQFSGSSTAADYIQWARVKGLNPNGGWQPSAALTRDALAQILVQLLKINPNKLGADYVKILEREGIIIPASGTMDRESLLSVLGDPTFRVHGPRGDHNGDGHPDNGQHNHSPFKPHPPHPGDGSGFPPGPPPGHGPGTGHGHEKIR
jgi:hypothetical protein